MNFLDLTKQCRSYRKFHENERITKDQLKDWIALHKYFPSSANLQPLKFALYTEEKDCDLIFPETGWAGYLKDWAGPEKGEQPSAYIVILGDTNISKNFKVDTGIVAYGIMLAATEAGYGGCMIGALKKEKLREKLQIDEQYEILLVLALGKPNEEILIEDIKYGDIKYYRDENQIHHVPKRGLDELIIE